MTVRTRRVAGSRALRIRARGVYTLRLAYPSGGRVRAGAPFRVRAR